MAVVFEQINSEDLAQSSYNVVGDKAGVAAVIDPRRTTDGYIERARTRRADKRDCLRRAS